MDIMIINLQLISKILNSINNFSMHYTVEYTNKTITQFVASVIKTHDKLNNLI